jgi:hypothetical protein
MNNVERKPSFPFKPVDPMITKLIKAAATMSSEVDNRCLLVVFQGFCGVGNVFRLIGPYLQNYL